MNYFKNLPSLSISIAIRFFIGKGEKCRLKVRPKKQFCFRYHKQDMTQNCLPYLALRWCMYVDFDY